jgi:hypothetical protein
MYIPKKRNYIRYISAIGYWLSLYTIGNGQRKLVDLHSKENRHTLAFYFQLYLIEDKTAAYFRISHSIDLIFFLPWKKMLILYTRWNVKFKIDVFVFRGNT